MKLSELIQRIEKRIPKAWAAEWDNTGLSYGDLTCDIDLIAMSLDATPSAVKKSAMIGADLLITHHPAIFRPLTSLTATKSGVMAVTAAIKNDIALYSLHTNWDASPEGVNVALARLIELENIFPLAKPKRENGAFGIGAVGRFKRAMSIDECSSLLKERWHLSDIRFHGNPPSSIDRIAIGGGACSDMWQDAIDAGASVFVTSDISYHNRLDALEMGLFLMETDHGEAERASLPFLKNIVEEETMIPVTILD